MGRALVKAVLLIGMLLLVSCQGGGGQTVRGTVTVSGEPAADAPVSLHQAAGGQDIEVSEDTIVASTTADSSGAFVLEGEAGEYIASAEVEIADVGTCQVAAFLTVEEGTPAQVDLEVPADFVLSGGGISLLINGQFLFC